MLEQLENMTDMRKEHFRDVVNELLEHTYIFKYEYSDNETRKYSDDFYFAQENIDIINDYLDVIGYRITIDNNYGICYVSSFPPSARARFDKLSTSLILTLRHIYENERENISSSSVVISVGKLISQFMDIAEISKKPSNKEITASLRAIKNAHLIDKSKGNFDDDSTKIMILPSILIAVPAQRIIEIEEEFIGEEEDIDISDDEGHEE